MPVAPWTHSSMTQPNAYRSRPVVRTRGAWRPATDKKRGSSAESTSKHKISPIEDILVGLLNLAIALVLAMGRDAALRTRREQRRKAQQSTRQSHMRWSERMLAKGSARVTFSSGRY